MCSVWFRHTLMAPLFRRSLETRLQLRDDLLVIRSEVERFRGNWLSPAFDVLNDVEQDLGCAQIGLGRAIDELRDDRFALADPASALAVRDGDALVERFAQQRRQILHSRRPASRIAGST